MRNNKLLIIVLFVVLIGISYVSVDRVIYGKKSCNEHKGCKIVYTTDGCPICDELGYKEFKLKQAKVLLMEIYVAFNQVLTEENEQNYKQWKKDVEEYKKLTGRE